MKKLAPEVGLEPTTLRLTAGCSAIELLRSNGGNGSFNPRPSPQSTGLSATGLNPRGIQPRTRQGYPVLLPAPFAVRRCEKKLSPRAGLSPAARCRTHVGSCQALPVFSHALNVAARCEPAGESGCPDGLAAVPIERLREDRGNLRRLAPFDLVAREHKNRLSVLKQRH